MSLGSLAGSVSRRRADPRDVIAPFLDRRPICTPDYPIPTQLVAAPLFLRSLPVLYIEGRLTEKVRKHARKGSENGKAWAKLPNL
jgi:hypothetical protein